MSNFDWLDYDESPAFKQGIAIVRRYGKFGAVMVGGKEIVPPIYDNLSEFKDGYAVAKWNNEERVINLSGQIRVLKDNKEIFLPEEYDWGFDFIEDICIVEKNDKYGIVNDKFELIIPCEYEFVEALSDVLFKFKEGGKWGIIDKSGKLIAGAEYVNLTYETESLLMVETCVQNGSYTEPRYGFLDRQGKVIVPAQCKTIKRIEQENNIFFIAEINWNKGVWDKDGKIIVPFIYRKISQEGRLFYCYSGNISSVYNSVGEHMLYISDTQYVIIPTEYEYAQYAGCGLIQVSKAGKWGLIDTFGQVIVETKFTCIDKFDGSFAIVGISSGDKKMEYGLIDTSGEIVLSVEYEDIKKWDNDYYAIRKNGLYGLLSPTLKMTIKPSKEGLIKLNEKYILVKERSEYSTAYMNGLIDYYGNEIIPAYKNFSEVIVLENGFLKVIYDRSQYKGCSHIGILNVKGKEIYFNNKCDDITYIGNGLLLIKGHAGDDTYNIANLQGKVLFNTYYDYIEILENGNFLICKNNCYGMARSTGEIFIHPRYTNRIEFENGIAKIQVKGSNEEHHIDTNGQVIVLDSNKNEIRIPKDYYWGTDFINGISIVRTTNHPYYGDDTVGVINKIGEVVIPVKYDNIKLLSDNTLLVNKDDCYGLFDITSKCILPDIFTTLEHINRDKVRVIWNLDKVKSWSLGEYIPGPNKSSSSDIDYTVNNRSALCDTKGNIISDSKLVCIGKFNEGYACCYRKIEVINNNIVLKQVGIIDINGTTIVDPEYDGIILYHYPYARLKKGKIYGIADLKNRKTILFHDINIKKTEYVDSFGRFIYTDGDCCNQEKNQGVIGLQGIIVPSGKYSNIELLENGLIKVSNEDNTLYGLLDLKGEELLKMEYSYISSFKYGYATVCIGGNYEEDDFARKIVGGKWGIIDKTGKFIVKCIHNEEQKLSAEDIIKCELIDDSEFDSYGRLLFDEWEEINRCSMGVIGRDGIIVPTGKYHNIRLLDNGLIKVSSGENTLYGLLDTKGKELLEMKYSYISAFKNGHASICLGGYDNGLWQIGGKWGVIDDTGKIVIECIHNEEQLLTTENTIEKSIVNEYGEPIIPILCSDYIPVDASSNIGSDYYDNYNDYEDNPSVDDNPYYNDNLDMDQQSIEFWNSF